MNTTERIAELTSLIKQTHNTMLIESAKEYPDTDKIDTLHSRTKFWLTIIDDLSVQAESDYSHSIGILCDFTNAITSKINSINMQSVLSLVNGDSFEAERLADLSDQIVYLLASYLARPVQN